MTTRELINALLDSPMDEEVKLYIEKKHTDEYGIECSGWLFHIDSIEHKVLIKFTDWRDEQAEIQEVKTEPNSSEKPNNCETCRHWQIRKDIYDLEDAYCELFYDNVPCRFEPKDETQTDCAWK